MDKLVLIVDQISLAKSLIGSGTISSMRIALLWLDNATEILMYRKIQAEYVFGELYQRMLDKLNVRPLDIEGEKLKGEITRKAISPKQKKSLDWDYDSKTRFLTDKQVINDQEAAFMRIMHQYRNDVYHNDVIHRDVLHHMTSIFFDLICDIFPKLAKSQTYGGDEFELE